MRIAQHIRKPSNWQDFEKLCLALWKEEWKSDDLKLNGRLGQEQHGVDVCGHREGCSGYWGIQCKCKTERDALTPKEIEYEIEKAKQFKPSLVHLVLATTSEKDARIEEYVRQKDEELRKEGLFSLDIRSWGDIVTMLEFYPNVQNWYLGISSDDYDIRVCFSDDKDVLEGEVSYLKVPNSKTYYAEINSVRKRYSYSAMSYFSGEKRLYEKNLSYLEIPIVLKNIGESPLDDYKIKLRFDQEVLLSTNNCKHYSTTNVVADSDFILDLYIDHGVVEYSSRFSLVSGDVDSIPHFFVKAPLGTKNMVLNWELLSRNYHDSGKLDIHIKETIHTISLETCSVPVDQWEIVDWIYLKES